MILLALLLALSSARNRISRAGIGERLPTRFRG